MLLRISLAHISVTSVALGFHWLSYFNGDDVSHTVWRPSFVLDYTSDCFLGYFGLALLIACAALCVVALVFHWLASQLHRALERQFLQSFVSLASISEARTLSLAEETDAEIDTKADIKTVERIAMHIDMKADTKTGMKKVNPMNGLNFYFF